MTHQHKHSAESEPSAVSQLMSALQEALSPAIQATVDRVEKVAHERIANVEASVKNDLTTRDTKLAGQTSNLSVNVATLNSRFEQMTKDIQRQAELNANLQKTILDKFSVDDRMVADLLAAIENLGRSLQTQNLQLGEFMRQQEMNAKQTALVTESLKKILADLKDKSVVAVLKKQVADLQSFQRDLLRARTDIGSAKGAKR